MASWKRSNVQKQRILPSINNKLDLLLSKKAKKPNWTAKPGKSCVCVWAWWKSYTTTIKIDSSTSICVSKEIPEIYPNHPSSRWELIHFWKRKRKNQELSIPISSFFSLSDPWPRSLNHEGIFFFLKWSKNSRARITLDKLGKLNDFENSPENASDLCCPMGDAERSNSNDKIGGLNISRNHFQLTQKMLTLLEQVILGLFRWRRPNF